MTFGKHVHSLQGSAFLTNQALTAGAHIVHFQQTDAGLVTWTMHSKGESVLDGNAAVEMAAGSLPAELVGSTRPTALLGTGTGYTLGNGTIKLPA